MKRLYPIICLTLTASVIITAMTACGSNGGSSDVGISQTNGYTYYPAASDVPSDITESTGQSDLDSTAGEEPTAVGTNANPSNQTPAASTAPSKNNTSTEEKTTAKQSVTTAAPPSKTEKTTVSPNETNVDLSIEVPSANGTMEVDTSRGNKFTVIVSEERKIDAAYLVAVYSVPDSGQNYVFEFTSKTSRAEDDLRRVYLIDKNGKITGVAAKNANEKENVSAVENWFCMNVLIKKMIFPAIKDEF